MEKKRALFIVLFSAIVVFIIVANFRTLSVTTCHEQPSHKQQSTTSAQKKVAESSSLSIKEKNFIKEFGEHFEKQKAIAEDKGFKTDFYDENGNRFSFVYFDSSGVPRYYSTCNKNAAITTSTSALKTSPYDLHGQGMSIGVWDSGTALTNHKVFSIDGTYTKFRVINNDNSPVSGHTTHVTGTLIAVGLIVEDESAENPSTSEGMAKRATALCHSWSNEYEEMSNAAATDNTISNKINVSNHSYGVVCGWRKSGSNYEWWGSSSSQEDSEFGRYLGSSTSFNSAHFDQVTESHPYYLPFCSAGNDRDDNYHNEIMLLTTPQYYIGADRTNPIPFDPETAPHPDDYNGGYDRIIPPGTAKNVVTVGSIHDAVANGDRYISDSTLMSSFSGWGPCDDGRIKPDIVANGESLLSAWSDHDQDGRFLTGTSMSAPNASGSALLLQEHFYKKSGHTMRASTLKGLILHNAYDLGNPGPDYSFGWGLMDALKSAQAIDSHYTAASDTIIQENNLIESTTDNIMLVADGTSDISATICWTDPAHSGIYGVNNTTPALVNDLDLRIIGSEEHRPWTLGGLANPSANATQGDNSVDNIEQVVISSPLQNESFTLTVSHKDGLQGGNQNYSLIATGIKTLFVKGNDKYIATNNQATKEADNTYFGSMKPGQTKNNAFQIVNYSAETITLDSIVFSDNTNFSTTEALPVTVNAGSETSINITFSPQYEDMHTTSATLTFSNETTYIINLSGTAIIVTATEDEENLEHIYPDDVANNPGSGTGEELPANYNTESSVTFTVHVGWNLLSMPFTSSNKYLATLRDRGMVAWNWDKESQAYVQANDISPLGGLWVYNGNERAVVININDEIHNSKELVVSPGWNLTGFPSAISIDTLPSELPCYTWAAGKYRTTNSLDYTNSYWIFNPTSREKVITAQ